jgi:hypothetical protein
MNTVSTFQMRYGPKLSTDEYVSAVRRSVREQPLCASDLDEQQRAGELCETELDLMIDHRLGRQFPSGKRQSMVLAYREMIVDRANALEKLQTGAINSVCYVHEMQRLADSLLRKFESILAADEFAAFVDQEPGLPANLLIDPSQV